MPAATARIYVVYVREHQLANGSRNALPLPVSRAGLVEVDQGVSGVYLRGVYDSVPVQGLPRARYVYELW